MTAPIFASVDAQKLLLSTLRMLSVAKVVVDFSGSGDSGSIDGHRATNANDDDVDLHTTTLIWPRVRSKHEYVNGSYKYTITSSNESMTIAEIVEHLCDIALEHSQLDWYNNDGGQGSFIIDLSKNIPNITLEVGVNYTQVDTTFFDFYELMTEDTANAPMPPQLEQR